MRWTTPSRSVPTRARSARPGADGSDDAGGAETRFGARAGVELRCLFEVERVGPHHHELRDPVPHRDLESGTPVGVQQQDAQLAAVAGVDQPRRIGQCDAVLGGEPGARQNEPRVACGNRNRDARADARTLAWLEPGRLNRAQVVARIVLVRALRLARGRRQPLEADPQAGGRPFSSYGRSRAATPAGTRARTRTPSGVSSRSRSPA